LISYLVDTNHASLLFRMVPEVVSAFESRSTAPLFLCMPGVGELWYMVHNSRQRDQNVADMRRFIEGFNVLDFGDVAAEMFGIIKTDLRKLGKPIPDVDVQIAAVARTMNLTLLTDDAHFSSVPGLVTENWLRP
jgi:tRNA(fMet)-specific endonuclease VapC